MWRPLLLVLLSACTARAYRSRTIAAVDDTVHVSGRHLYNATSQSIGYQWSSIGFSVGVQCATSANVSVLLAPAQEEVHKWSITCSDTSRSSSSTRLEAVEHSAAREYPLGPVEGSCVVSVIKKTEAWECNAPNHVPGSYIEKPASFFHGFEAENFPISPPPNLHLTPTVCCVMDACLAKSPILQAPSTAHQCGRRVR